jgi:iron complex outermembrane receptor protein
MKSFLFFVACILCHTILFAQDTGSIRGTIKTSDGNPAAYVNIALEQTSKGTVANASGEYKLTGIAPGTYTLVASFVGLSSQRQTVDVRAGEQSTADFVLNENAEQLQEIVVSGRHMAESPFVAKMPLKNMENPQVLSSVSSEILKQQAVTSFDDALNNVPGIHKLWESTGRGGDGASYYALRGFEAQATMINGLPGLTNGSLDPSNIERIEVIKGPSGTLFGSSLISYGGLVNTVTKRPHSGFAGEVSYLAGSFGLNRITADVNAPIVNNDVIVRVNTAYHTENSFQDAGFRKSFFIAPSLSYKVNDRLSFLVSTEFMQEEKTNPAMVFLGRDTPLQFENLAALNYNPDLSLTSNDLSIRNPRYNLQGQMNYKLSDTWTSQTVLSRGVARSEGYYSYLYDNENGLGEFGLYFSRQQAQTLSSDIQQNFVGDFKIGNMRNRLVAGLDYFQRNVIDNGSGYSWVHNVTPQGDISNINPFTGEEEIHYLTRPSIDALLASSGMNSNNTKDASYSVYFSDVINITPQLLAMASLRLDYFDTEGDVKTSDDDYDQTALSPKFGLVYQPIADKLSLFANYMNGFKNVAPSLVYDASGKNVIGVRTFEAEHANQLEFGSKLNLFSDALIVTASYYDISVENVVTAEPGGNGRNMVQGGEVRSKGFEFDLNANPVKGLNIIAGFSHNDSEVVKGDEANVWLETGRRPIYSGPADMVNFWATYAFSSGALNGFGVGAGGNYSSSLPILDSKVTGTFRLPEYTVINASVFYNMSRVRVAVNVNNVADKRYYTGYSTVNPQKPRNGTLSISYKF